MAEFNVCPKGHPLPVWWKQDFCLRCDYEAGMERLKAISEALGPGSFPEYSVTHPVTHGAVTHEKTCEVCNKPFEGRGKACNACRQRAYRGRK